MQAVLVLVILIPWALSPQPTQQYNKCSHRVCNHSWHTDGDVDNEDSGGTIMGVRVAQLGQYTPTPAYWLRREQVPSNNQKANSFLISFINGRKGENSTWMCNGLWYETYVNIFWEWQITDMVDILPVYVYLGCTPCASLYPFSSFYSCFSGRPSFCQSSTMPCSPRWLQPWPPNVPISFLYWCHDLCIDAMTFVLMPWPIDSPSSQCTHTRSLPVSIKSAISSTQWCNPWLPHDNSLPSVSIRQQL